MLKNKYYQYCRQLKTIQTKEEQFVLDKLADKLLFIAW